MMDPSHPYHGLGAGSDRAKKPGHFRATGRIAGKVSTSQEKWLGW